MHDHSKFSLAFMRDFVPEKLRPWIMVLIAVVFQFSGGVYLAVVSEMGGALALKQEDIMMAGYASMVSMALSFAILFRLKFRFPPRTSLSVCAVVIILANLICLNTGNVVVLVLVSFIAGFFRMWGTFECNSSLQLWITPKRDHFLHKKLADFQRVFLFMVRYLVRYLYNFNDKNLGSESELTPSPNRHFSSLHLLFQRKLYHLRQQSHHVWQNTYTP